MAWMKKSAMLFLTFFLLLVGKAVMTNTMASTISPAEANTAFALDFFKKVAEEDKTGNVFFSPFSITSALAMVMLGTRGNTNTQIAEVLRFTEPLNAGQGETATMECPMPMQLQMQVQTGIDLSPGLPNYLRKCLNKEQGAGDDIHAKMGQLRDDLNKTSANYLLYIANKLYGEKTFEFVEEFLTDLNKHYSAELESVDFIEAAEEARININGWVEQKTQGKIKDLLGAGALSSETRLVLVNAIHFKGKWMEQFKEEDTVDAEFRITKIDTRTVKMMRQKTKFSIAEVPEVNCKVLELPYVEKTISMLIFLPNDFEDETTGLEKLEMALTPDKFVEWTRPEMMVETEVDVKLPRFKLEETYDLKGILISMGIVDAFEVTRSDFSAMSPSNDLVLSKVVHKANVEVTEEGTEAAAATGVVISVTSITIPVFFHADRPFLFFIRHNPTNTILFAGRYSSPE